MGTWARMIWVLPLVSMPAMRPRRPFRSPIRSPAYSTGAWISTFMMGSSSAGLASCMAALKALRAASLKASSDESTSW